MYWEINVAYAGRHFFATAERSLTTEFQARAAYQTIKAKFPEIEGYKVTVHYCENVSHQINFEEGK